MLIVRTLLTFLRDPEYRDLLITTGIVILFGTVVYHYLEGWHWVDSLYFSVITLTTVGYGDFSPQTTEGKLFTVFYIVLGVGIILSFINTVYNHYNEVRSKEKSSQSTKGPQ